MTSIYLLSFLCGLVYGGVWVHSSVVGNKIWIINPCDRPLTNSGSKSACCSSLGYSHSKQWGDYFMEHVSKPVLIVSSGYTYEKYCSEISNLTVVPPLKSLLSFSSDCRNSQHMYLTAYAVYFRLEHKVEGEVNTDFCVGQERELVAFLKKRVYGRGSEFAAGGDVVVVWEHHATVDILRHFGFQVVRWRNLLNKHYELAFWIDVRAGKWGYRCYEYGREGSECSASVVDLLGNFREADLNGFKYLGEEDLGMRIQMIVVLGALVGCGIGLVAFLIFREISSKEDSEVLFSGSLRIICS